MSMTDTFPPDVQQFVRQEIACGNFRNEQELVVKAVRSLRDSEENFQRFRREVQEAVDSLDRGEGIELEGEEALAAFLDEIEAEVHAEMAAEKKTNA
jgi:Arc/MetJ-type ribon-helix-helix transcriptional regulator